jgi:hypothetical protein
MKSTLGSKSPATATSFPGPALRDLRSKQRLLEIQRCPARSLLTNENRVFALRIPAGPIVLAALSIFGQVEGRIVPAVADALVGERVTALKAQVVLGERVA